MPLVAGDTMCFDVKCFCFGVGDDPGDREGEEEGIGLGADIVAEPIEAPADAVSSSPPPLLPLPSIFRGVGPGGLTSGSDASS